MRSFLRPVGLALSLVVGILPVATAVCQWNCAPGTHVAHESHQQAAPHHHHSSDTTGSASLQPATGATCDHVVAAASAITSGYLKLNSPTTIVLVNALVSVQGDEQFSTVAHS